MYQILYGAIKDSEIMTIKQVEHIKEVGGRREKMAKDAKESYKMSRTPILS